MSIRNCPGIIENASPKAFLAFAHGIKNKAISARLGNPGRVFLCLKIKIKIKPGIKQNSGVNFKLNFSLKISLKNRTRKSIIFMIKNNTKFDLKIKANSMARICYPGKLGFGYLLGIYFLGVTAGLKICQHHGKWGNSTASEILITGVTARDL